MFDFKGAGIIITITSGVEDTRKNPFKINSVRRKGRCQLKRVIEIRTQKDNQLLGTASNKTEAIELSKELIRSVKRIYMGKLYTILVILTLRWNILLQ